LKIARRARRGKPAGPGPDDDEIMFNAFHEL
jgi:hypothetical protein